MFEITILVAIFLTLWFGIWFGIFQLNEIRREISHPPQSPKPTTEAPPPLNEKSPSFNDAIGYSDEEEIEESEWVREQDDLLKLRRQQRGSL